MYSDIEDLFYKIYLKMMSIGPFKFFLITFVIIIGISLDSLLYPAIREMIRALYF